jgi:hypothetical protein
VLLKEPVAVRIIKQSIALFLQEKGLRKGLAWWWGGKPAKAATEAIWLFF